MAVPVRSELMVEVAGLARRTMVCWQRSQEARRNELRAAARALPAASELLAIPRRNIETLKCLGREAILEILKEIEGGPQ